MDMTRKNHSNDTEKILYLYYILSALVRAWGVIIGFTVPGFIKALLVTNDC